jgi:hypothetical protein
MYKLTATYFTYTMLDATGNRAEYVGSYLGRGIASRDTLRRFLRRNSIRREPSLVSVTGSYTSSWIAK